MDTEISVFNTFLGKFKIALFEGELVQSVFVPDVSELRTLAVHQEIVDQFTAYFQGDLQTFDIRMAPKGTAFQQEVWQAVAAIPYGSLITYGELAKRLGPNANPRNVGQANGQNPLAIVVPCHRVVGEDIKLTGYAWGVERKRKLLELEGALKQGTLF